jgi:hypothetical protein
MNIFQKPRLSLEEFLSKIGPLPEEAVILGICDDGLPFLLNVNDFLVHANILIENGKPMLETVANSVEFVGNKNIKVLVVSDAWRARASAQRSFAELNNTLLDVYKWATGKHFKQRVVLLIDGLENVSDRDSIQNLEWVLDNGNKLGLYVLASYSNYSKIQEVQEFCGFNYHIRNEGDCYVAQEGDHEILVRAL